MLKKCTARQRAIAVALVVGWSQAALAQGAAAAGGELDRAECVKLAHTKRALEARGVHDLLAREPGEVKAAGGTAAIDAVRGYIAVKEAVLFRCPPNVLNATAAPLGERLGKVPPLPGRGPVQTRRPVQTLVPLPVRRPI